MQGSSSNALSTGAFLSGVGVDTHIAFTDGGYGKIANVIADLQYLGLDQVRDGLSNGLKGSAPLSSYVTAAKAGIHFTLVTKAATSADLAAALALDDRLQTAVPGAIVAVEGPNEINFAPVTFNGVSGLQGALDLQSAIYAGVHSDPTLAGVAVDYFTGYGTGGVGVGPDPSLTPGLADFDTQHPYPRFGQAPAAYVSRSALVNTTNPAAPAVYTETGYSTAEVTPGVQAKYTLDLLFDTASQGIAKTYLYELMDAYAPGSAQGDHGWGLFDYTGAAKPAATAIHNLTTILRAAGAGAAVSPAASSLTYDVTGLAANGHTMMLQNPDGTYDVVVWAEPKIWDSTAGQEIAAAAQTATVTLSAPVVGYSVYDPMVGTSAISSGEATRAITVTVSDHPVIIKLGAVGGVQGTANADTLIAPDGQSNNLHGLAGADLIIGGSAYNSLHGDAGDDTIVGRSLTGDQLLGGQGDDLITAVQSKARNFLFGDLGNDTLLASSGGDTLRGDAGDDLLMGGAGADFLSGDTGLDTLTGGAGADIFRGAAGMGTSIVTDFHRAEGDRIRIDHGTQYAVTQAGPDVHIDMVGGGEMILTNTQLSSLTTGWLFVT